MTTIHPARRPLDGLDPYDADVVLRRALERAVREIVPTGTVRPKLVLVHDDHLAEVDLDRQATGDPVATLLSLADRLDIEHRLLFG